MMNELRKSRLYILLSETGREINNKEIQKAYDGFVQDTLSWLSESMDPVLMHRRLQLSRIEFSTLSKLLGCGQGEKYHKECFY